MTRPLRTALIALLLPVSGAAVAQVTSPPAGDDRNAPMTLAQFQARQADRMMAADTDRDGRISLAEWTAQMSGRGGGRGGGGYDPAQMFARIDANHDGFLDRGEIDAASAERFRRMDANGDGVVTPDERMASRGGSGHHHGHGDGAPSGTPQN